jgi:hypothetical protein
VGQLEFWPGCPLQHVPPILAVEAVEGAFGGDIDYAMLIKMFGAVPEATKGRRPGGFGGDSSIFAPCSLDISRRAKQAVENKNLACCGEGRNCGHEKTRRGFPPGQNSPVSISRVI